MNSKQGYALKLETAFRLNDAVPVSADEFRHDYYSALENGLGYLVAQGIILSSDINHWMEEYGFSGCSFDEIINDQVNLSALNEMISQISHYKSLSSSEE